MTINSDTKIVALLGDPVAHSLSPRIHNRAFAEVGLNLAYFAFRIDSIGLANSINGLKTFGFVGANVTLPHKQEVIFFLDSLTERAEKVGAVNTIVCEGSDNGIQLVGDNTDISGFVRPLESHRDRLSGSEAVVWGTGGSARAVVYALLHELDISRVHLVSRSTEKGDALAKMLDPDQDRIDVVKWDYAALSIQQSSLLVNTTPLGMTPDTLPSPCANPELIHDGQIVYDLVYNPAQTTLLGQAESAGAVQIGGLEMLLGQAAESFRIWTAKEFPFDAVRAELISE